MLNKFVINIIPNTSDSKNLENAFRKNAHYRWFPDRIRTQDLSQPNPILCTIKPPRGACLGPARTAIP